MPTCNNKGENCYNEPMKVMTVRVSNTIYDMDDNPKQIRKSIKVGWICPKCHSVKIKKDLPDLKGDYSKFKHKFP